MDFFVFHLMPWPNLPDDYEKHYDSAWVWAPNKFYDPQQGHHLYNRYLDELEYAEEIGFDGICVNEHHQNAYGNMPSPNVIAGMLARRTKRVKIAIVGNALPLYSPPTRVAEEWAMLDVVTGGRLICGMVVGGGPKYFSYNVNPTHAREMFREAHDMIIQAWTQPGPTEFYGKFWQTRYLNIWPKPLQQPHPPIWIPGAGSIETMQYVAEKRYAYMGIPYFHMDVFKKHFAFFRECCEKEGYTAEPKQMGFLAPIYVADTDEKARAEYEPHLWYFIKKLLPGLIMVPPGYTSPKSALKIFDALKNDRFISTCETWADIERGDFAIVGSPKTVRDKIIAHVKEIGAGNILGLFQLGTLPHDLTKRNMKLFADEVMPHVRREFEGKL